MAPSPADLEPGRTIYPSIDLVAGDKARTRVFDANGERTDLQTELTIASAGQGQKNNWAHALASKINAEQSQIRAGQQGRTASSTPSMARTRSTSRLAATCNGSRSSLSNSSPGENGISVSGLASDYTLDNGKLTLTFTVTAQGISPSPTPSMTTAVSPGDRAVPTSRTAARVSPWR
jgi:chitin-binding protein